MEYSIFYFKYHKILPKLTNIPFISFFFIFLSPNPFLFHLTYSLFNSIPTPTAISPPLIPTSLFSTFSQKILLFFLSFSNLNSISPICSISVQFLGDKMYFDHATVRKTNNYHGFFCANLKDLGVNMEFAKISGVNMEPPF